MAKIVILGAAGQIARKLTKALLDQTSYDLVLFGVETSNNGPCQKVSESALWRGTLKEQT